MELILNILLLLVGITILVWGANKFVYHASVIAKHLGVEDIALGTAIGSNISNIALIFGVSCLYLNAASKTHLWNLMPFGLTVLLLGLALMDGIISFRESWGFVGLFMLFMYILLQTDGVPDEGDSEASEFIKSLLLSMVGLVGLVAGANISIVYAESTAILLGVSELIVGLTIIALGTSLPELAASVAALKKGKHQMVVGNIIGSNVLNLVFVIPIIGFFGSVQLSPIVMERDFSVLAILSLAFILLAVALTKLKFNKSMYVVAGIILISSYSLYIATLAGIV